MNRTHLLLGVVLVVLGAAYLLDDLGVLTVRVAVLGPVLLIAAGLALAASAVEDTRP